MSNATIEQQNEIERLKDILAKAAGTLAGVAPVMIELGQHRVAQSCTERAKECRDAAGCVAHRHHDDDRDQT